MIVVLLSQKIKFIIESYILIGVSNEFSKS